MESRIVIPSALQQQAPLFRLWVVWFLVFINAQWSSSHTTTGAWAYTTPKSTTTTNSPLAFVFSRNQNITNKKRKINSQQISSLSASTTRIDYGSELPNNDDRTTTTLSVSSHKQQRQPDHHHPTNNNNNDQHQRGWLLLKQVVPLRWWIRPTKKKKNNTALLLAASTAATTSTTATIELYNQPTTSTTTTSSSVQLQLNEIQNNNQNSTPATTDTTTSTTTITTTTPSISIHTYRDPNTNQTWKAINTSRKKFRAYLQYRNVIRSNTAVGWWIQTTTITKKNNHNNAMEESVRQEWRTLWKQGRLLTDRTEILSVYPSEQQQNNEKSRVQRKRGGFADLLHLYTERIAAILIDEQEDARAQQQQPLSSSSTSSSMIDKSRTGTDMIAWLQAHYGMDNTEALRHENFVTLNTKDQLARLKHFLEWFRSFFPYFYDRCEHCGASIKEDKAAVDTAVVPSINTHDDTTTQLTGDSSPAGEDDDGDDDDEDNHKTFVGYIYPNEKELQGKASRTELYQCHVCASFTRFPRYNSASHVMDFRKGRCGEYSMLLFRFLRALQHECRWVVDWADHVWAEILISNTSTGHNRWVHLDPCEAAVDENYLYQGWGKKQTYILGFYLPPIRAVISRTSHASNNGIIGSNTFRHGAAWNFQHPVIEDITRAYTRESWLDVCKRREESEDQVREAIAKASEQLYERILQSTKYDLSTV